MTQLTYQVTLSADRNHSVSISGNDPEALKSALEHGRRLLAYATERPAAAHVEAERQSQIPTCPTHNAPMMHRVGTKGGFWFCPTKNENGGWCKYKRDAG